MLEVIGTAGQASKVNCCACSNVQLPIGTELAIFAPAATDGYKHCTRSCMHVTPESVPPSGKLTSTPMEGGHWPQMHGVWQPWPASHALPDHMRMAGFHAWRMTSQQKQGRLHPQGNPRRDIVWQELFPVHAEPTLLANVGTSSASCLIRRASVCLLLAEQCVNLSGSLGAACMARAHEDLLWRWSLSAVKRHAAVIMATPDNLMQSDSCLSQVLIGLGEE